jgi:general stress protein 26
MAEDHHPEAAERLAELIDDIRFATLTTRGADGSLRSRPMATQEERFDGALWFFTDADAAKVQEIAGDPRVNVSYAEPGRNRWVSVSGSAGVVRDRELVDRLWSAPLKAWFPDGRETPGIALLRVDVEKAEYWDAPSAKVVQLAGFVKALVTGRRIEPGENEQLDLEDASRPD